MHKFDDIIPPSRRKDSDDALANVAARRQSRRGKFPLLTVIVALAVIAGSIGALVYFSSARIEIVPNSATAEVQASLTAATEGGDLPFQVVSAEKVETQSVKSSGTKTVSSNASGMITIYNTQATAQKLITKTRFQTTAGLVYRIQAPVTVPGGSTDKPGSVTAKVVADQPGSSYNVGPTSFSVPGFAGTPQATQVYARSTSPMTGGASGTVPTVSAADEQAAREALEKKIAPALDEALKGLVPEGYVLLAGASATSYQTLEAAPGTTDGMADVRVQGTVSAVVFPNTALAKALAATVAGLNYQGETVELSSTESLKLASVDGLPASGATSFAFTVSGTAPIVYSVDASRIAAAVAGKTSDAAKVALTSYPEISTANIILRPFWKTAFPEDPAAISVVILHGN